MNRQERDNCKGIEIKNVVSVLPNDYSQLENLPSIDGITILGDISSKQLNLLSSDCNQYETLKLSNITGTERYVPVIAEDSAMNGKVPIDDFVEEGKIKITETFDEDVSVGTTQLVIIKDSNNNGG